MSQIAPGAANGASAKPAPQDLPNIGSENCLPIGTRLAEFEITSVIGEGGFGIVYLAFDHSLRRTVAIKEYMPAPLAARGADRSIAIRAKRHEEAFEAGLRSFINEARLLAQFDHPALIKVYRFWEEHKTAYMAMRFYEGHTFKHVVKEHPEMVDQVWLTQLLKPIMGALVTLYKMNILHRDISPENIMIQPNGDAVLLDFGAARQIVTGLAHTLTVILKPGYAPVEQYADDESMQQGAWTDIYSLSAVIYSAIAKKPPPTAVARMVSDAIEPLQNGNYPGFDKKFLAAIDQGLAVLPEKRPQSIEHFARMLGIDISLPEQSDNGARPPATAPAPSAPGREGGGKPAKPVKSERSERSDKSGKSVKSSKKPGVAAPKAPAKGPIKPSWLIAAGVGVLVLVAGVQFGMRYAAPLTGPEVAVAMPEPSAAPAPEPVAQDAAPAETPVADGTAANGAATAPQFPVPLPVPVTPATADAGKPLVKPVLPRKPKTVAEAPAAKVVDTSADDDNAKPTGTLTLAVMPWGNVYVDGVLKGVSPPLKKLNLPEGHHRVKIVNPAFPEYAVDVTVDANRPATVSRSFSAVP